MPASESNTRSKIYAAFNPLTYPICLAHPHRIAQSGWLSHIPFGMFLVGIFKPSVLVELGTHSGVSYCAFCQAVMELGLPTRCYAIDTWQGDAHTGFYGEEVFTELRQYHDALYGSFSHLIRSNFDDAVHRFEDRSIDFLHIDGYHTYVAVRHDFETWLPKMSERGLVLLHDITVKDRDFGVWKLWEDLKPRYPHFEMLHGFGLGVLAVGDRIDDSLAWLFVLSDEEASLVRRFFLQLGERLTLTQEVCVLKNVIEQQSREIHNQQIYISQLEQVMREPLCRLARAWTRYGILGLVRRGVARLLKPPMH